MNQKEFIYNQLLLEYHLISRKILDIEQLYANHNKEQLEELSNLKKRQNLIKVEFENLFKIKPTPRKVIGKKVTVPEKKPQIIKKEKTRWEIYVETCKSLTPKLSKDFPKIDKNSYKNHYLLKQENWTTMSL